MSNQVKLYIYKSGEEATGETCMICVETVNLQKSNTIKEMASHKHKRFVIIHLILHTK